MMEGYHLGFWFGLLDAASEGKRKESSVMHGIAAYCLPSHQDSGAVSYR